jgi:hypothetical protein
MSRSRVPEQGENYLEQKLTLYKQFAETFHFTSIDATQSEEALLKLLITDIESGK